MILILLLLWGFTGLMLSPYALCLMLNLVCSIDFSLANDYGAMKQTLAPLLFLSVFFFVWVLFIWDILANQLFGYVSFRMYENLFQGFVSRWECAGLASFLFLNALTQRMIFQKIITNNQSLFSSFVCFVVSISMWVSFKPGLFC